MSQTYLYRLTFPIKHPPTSSENAAHSVKSPPAYASHLCNLIFDYPPRHRHRLSLSARYLVPHRCSVNDFWLKFPGTCRNSINVSSLDSLGSLLSKAYLREVLFFLFVCFLCFCNHTYKWCKKTVSWPCPARSWQRTLGDLKMPRRVMWYRCPGANR